MKTIIYIVIGAAAAIYIYNALSGGHGKPPVVYEKGMGTPITGTRVL